MSAVFDVDDDWELDELPPTAEVGGGRVWAGRTAAEAPVAFDDLPLLEAAEKALQDLAVLHAAALELRDRLWAGRLDADARDDLAIDVLEAAARVQGFALAVRA